MRCCISLLLCLTFGLSLFAQSDRGVITGTVADPANAVIQGAKITVKSTETGATYETVTTGTGNYTLPSLPAGNYDLTVESAGFNRHVQTGINVQVAQTARIDIIMKVGSTSDSVTINADAPLLKTESAEQSQTITGDRINELPLTSSAGGVRNPVAGVILAPGVQNPPGSNIQIRVNGGINNTYKALMDGQDITQSGTDPTHLSESQPSADALQEVTLQSSNFAAEFGQVAGGLINITSRSGTNKYHGSGYEYFTNEALNAGRPYTNTGKNGTLLRPRSRNNDFGFTVGGPLSIPKLYNGKDKTFFFFNMEEYRTTATGSGFTTVATDAYRNGDFSSVLTGRTLTDSFGNKIPEGAIFDPKSDIVVNGQVTRTQFPGNIIPASRFDPVALKIQALLPQATIAGALTNNLPVGDATQRQTYIPSLKIDHSISERTKISAYVGDFWQNVPKSGADGLTFPVSPARNFVDRTPTFRLNLDQTITPTFLVHVGIGDVRYDHIDSAPPIVLNYDAPKLLGLVGAGVTPAGFPRITGISGTQGGSPNIGPTNANDYYNDKPTLVASATLIKGNHTYKAGGEWRRDIWSDVNTRGSQGIYNFSPNETALPYLQSTSVGGGTIGFGYASFLLGAVDTASTANKQDPQIRKTGLGLYAQDTWKFNRKLTFDYGVRYDYETGWREIHNRTAIFGPSVINPSAGGLKGGTQYEGSGPGAHCNCSFAKNYPWGFAPRFGVAYQINPKTVFRGGWGLVYGRTADGGYVTNTAIVGVGYNTLNFSNASFGEPAVFLQNGLQYSPADLNAATFDPGIRPQAGTLNSPPYYIDPGAGRPSRVNQWNISLQREIAKDLVFEAAYVGNRGSWLQGDRLQDWNGLTPAALLKAGFDITNATDRSILTSQWSSAAAVARGIKPPYAGYPATTVAQTLRPFPQFGNITSKWTSLGNSWYDSLQTKVTKRFSHGFDATGAFTWQKELSRGIDAVNDEYNLNQNKYISASSQPLAMVISFNYQTPAFTSNKLVRTAVRGWTFAGVGRYASGLPIQSPNAQNNLNTLLLRVNGASFANRVPGQPLFLKDLNCHCIDPNKDLVLNPAAWTDPAPGTFGTAAAYYNDYRQQRRPSEQLGVGRVFQIHEGMTFQLRAEFFNVFNRTEQGNPTSTNALQSTVRNSAGVPTAGFGYINSQSLFSSPRSGQLIARIAF